MLNRRRGTATLIILIITIVCLSMDIDKSTGATKISSGSIERSKDHELYKIEDIEEYEEIEEETEQQEIEETEQQEIEETEEETSEYWDYLEGKEITDFYMGIEDKIGEEVKLVSRVSTEPEIDGEDIYIQIATSDKEIDSNAIVKYGGGKDTKVIKGDSIAVIGDVYGTFDIIQLSGEYIKIPIILVRELEIIYDDVVSQ